MEEAFKKLQKDKQNSVDNLIKLMKDSKIVDGKKVTEDKARKLFEDIKDASNVELAKFEEAIAKLAIEEKESIEECAKGIATESANFFGALIAAANAAAAAATSAFKEAMKKK